MNLEWTTPPRCSFAVRYPAGHGTWRYQHVSMSSPWGSGTMPMPHPPAVDDLVILVSSPGPQPEGGPVFRVVRRCWSYPVYGSPSWPYASQQPADGGLLEIIVEPAAGPYLNETPCCAESTCERYLTDGQWVMPPGEEDHAVPHEHRPWQPRS